MSQTLLAVDPGSERSAWVLYLAGSILEHGLAENRVVRAELPRLRAVHPTALLLIEFPRAYAVMPKSAPGADGKPRGRPFVPQQVLVTCREAGRFIERWGEPYYDLDRSEVKRTLCGWRGATDAHVRAAIVARYGGSREVAVGTKAKPGPLWGIKADEFAALALALAWREGHAARVSA